MHWIFSPNMQDFILISSYSQRDDVILMKGKVATSLLAILVTVDRKTKLVLRTGFHGQVALLYISTLTMTGVDPAVILGGSIDPSAGFPFWHPFDFPPTPT